MDEARLERIGFMQSTSEIRQMGYSYYLNLFLLNLTFLCQILKYFLLAWTELKLFLSNWIKFLIKLNLINFLFKLNWKFEMNKMYSGPKKANNWRQQGLSLVKSYLTACKNISSSWQCQDVSGQLGIFIAPFVTNPTLHERDFLFFFPHCNIVWPCGVPSFFCGGRDFSCFVFVFSPPLGKGSYCRCS